MTKEEYGIYLKSDHWRKLRSKKIELDGYICQICGSKDKLEVHHLRYKNIYDVNLDDLQVLCHLCHQGYHLKLTDTIKVDSEYYRQMAKAGKHKKKKQPKWVLDIIKKKISKRKSFFGRKSFNRTLNG